MPDEIKEATEEAAPKRRGRKPKAQVEAENLAQEPAEEVVEAAPEEPAAETASEAVPAEAEAEAVEELATADESTQEEIVPEETSPEETSPAEAPPETDEYHAVCSLDANIPEEADSDEAEVETLVHVDVAPRQKATKYFGKPITLFRSPSTHAPIASISGWVTYESEQTSNGFIKVSHVIPGKGRVLGFIRHQ